MTHKHALIFPIGEGRYECRLDVPLGQILKAARTQKGISLRELADRVGCSHVYVHNFETGTRVPSVRLLDALQRELSLDPFYLVPADDVGSIFSYSGESIDGTVEAPSTESLMFILLGALRSAGFASAAPREISRPEKKNGALAGISLAQGCPVEITIKQK